MTFWGRTSILVGKQKHNVRKSWWILSDIISVLTITNRPLYGCEGMLGNQDKMAGNSKVFMGIQSQLILPV